LKKGKGREKGGHNPRGDRVIGNGPWHPLPLLSEKSTPE